MKERWKKSRDREFHAKEWTPLSLKFSQMYSRFRFIQAKINQLPEKLRTEIIKLHSTQHNTMRNEKKIDENQKQTEKSTYIKTLSTNIGTVCVCVWFCSVLRKNYKNNSWFCWLFIDTKNISAMLLFFFLSSSAIDRVFVDILHESGSKTFYCDI